MRRPDSGRTPSDDATYDTSRTITNTTTTTTSSPTPIVISERRGAYCGASDLDGGAGAYRVDRNAIAASRSLLISSGDFPVGLVELGPERRCSPLCFLSSLPSLSIDSLGGETTFLVASIKPVLEEGQDDSRENGDDSADPDRVHAANPPLLTVRSVFRGRSDVKPIATVESSARSSLVADGLREDER